jgi:hypothetical protein
MNTPEFNKHRMQTIVNEGITELKKEAEHVINHIHNELCVNNAQSVSRLPEEIFVNYFLPMFIGAYKDEGKRLVEWISIAGTPSSPVNIIDTQGHVLFKVPGVYNVSYTLGSNKESLNSIITKFGLYKNHPSYNEDALLKASLKESIKEPEYHEDKKLWLDILMRYDLIQENKQSKTTDTYNTNIDDFLDYD